MRPTSESIMKSFQNSGKKHIIITGSIGHGKTTLKNKLLKLIDAEKQVFPGITTYMIVGKGVMLQNNLSKKEAMIGELCSDSLTGQKFMKTVSQGFANLGVKTLKEASNSDEPWVVIDEIGFLERDEEAFQEAVRNIFDEKNVICILRKDDLPFLNELRGRSDIYLVDVDEKYQKIGCVVMASGQGKRFGSNKLLADFKGKKLYQQALDLMDPRLFDKIVVVTRTSEVYEEAIERGFKAVLHNKTDRNEVVKLGIEQMKEMDACVFCPCDQPLLKKESLENLIKIYCKSDKKILRLAWKDCPGTPVLFSKEYFQELASLPTKKGGSYLIKKYTDDIAVVQVIEKNELKDIDTREDLNSLLVN